MYKNQSEDYLEGKKTILFAVGGTGGHLFPAQALAKQLKEDNPKINLLFAGGRLGSNPFFHKLHFPFKEISSATPFRGGILAAFGKIAKGVFQSLSLIGEARPDLIVGFGSFYSFPLLVAARLKRTPYLLVELNALPGKVNCLFSSKASLSALQFIEASDKLKGATVQVKIPYWPQELQEDVISKGEARKKFGLHPDTLTLLIFGGSQGAQAINKAVINISFNIPFQVVHICGRDQDANALKEAWCMRGIKAAVKHFEEKMHLAWKVADVAICRGGAGTCSEVIKHAIPALLIPWPGASENHQAANAELLCEKGGALIVQQGELDEALGSAVEKLVENREVMKKHLKEINQSDIEELKTAVMRELM
jgi:UDP-N-acetylglucosamine--N-acetylmuramyl-(pentapeptide) pyrophosphoryl-undecaprenol N-acetylglucosamine transferase